MDLNLTNSQTPILVSSNATAVNDRNYTVVANATFTDPSPLEGKGFKVFVRNGTAVIGGTSYGANSLVFRVFHSGAWANTLINVDLTNFYTKTETDTLLNAKVDKVTGSRLITSLESTLLSNTSGTNSGDETTSTIKTKLGITTLSGSNTGDQDLSGLLIKNTAITGSTKTKVTYDSKGLVTAGADATTADIADSTNKRYVTDANLVVVGNTSGTNSGNETASTIGAIVNGASSATPNDSDLVATVESSVVKKITWSNVKSFLKTYFDTIYTTTSAVASQITTALNSYLNKSGDIITGDIGNSSTGFFRVASGTTAQRPGTPLDGMIRYNSTTQRTEFYANSQWRNMARLEGDAFTGAISATNLSGTNTGDETQSSIFSKLKLAIKKGINYSAVTGTTAETLVGTLIFPANSFEASDSLRLLVNATRSGTIGTAATVRVKVNSVNDFSTATTIATITTTNSVQTYFGLVRENMFISGGNLQGFVFTTSALTDNGLLAIAPSSVSVDVTQPLHFFVSLANSSTSESNQIRVFKISNI